MSERLTFGRAINRGLHRALADDPKVLLMGEDIGALGGVFRITDGLQAEFGEDRHVETRQLNAAIDRSLLDLSALQKRLAEDSDPEKAAIFAAHAEFLSDPELLDLVEPCSQLLTCPARFSENPSILEGNI